MTQPVFDMKVRDLAEKIYIGLVTDAVDATATPPRMKADPAGLASASFRLAATFHEVQDRLNEQNLPKNQDFTMKVEDIAKWSA